MTTLAMQRDALMPRPPGGTGPGFVLALIVHMLLVAAIAFGVNWRSSEPEGVQAELWASVPQIAAPKAVEPEPTPVPPVPPEPKPEPKPVVKPEPAPVPKQETRPDAQIAIEKAKREDQRKKKEEAEKLAQQQKAEKVKLEKEEKRKKEQEDQKLAEFHAKEMKRILGQAGGTETKVEGNSTKTAGPSASYAGRIKARIRPNITFMDPISGNPLATVLVKLAPDGTIIDKRLVKSSGVPAWDAAVMRAIEKTEILPRDIDGRVPPPFEIDFRPQD